MIIIPDIHGRSFWKEQIKGKEDEEIVFLGDYMDPYPYEEEFNNLSPNEIFEKSMENFFKIIQLKKEHPKNVTLLLGNHDCHYFLGTDKGTRYDYLNAGYIYGIFSRNSRLFQMAYEKEINGKRFIFSHAGIAKPWLEYHELIIKGWTDTNIVDFVNNAYESQNEKFFSILNDISYRRRGFYDHGSMIWASVMEYSNHEEDLFGDFQVFGHTQLEDEPIFTDKIACIDCRKVFIIDNNGILRHSDGTEVLKTE